MFEKILNWKLLKGSHEFPGPDGGTCINEAAIVAAGFKYKKVISCWDCPQCFSRPIAAYAIVLNDRMPGDLRQELLMPFVTRLAGSADNPGVESARLGLIALRTIRDILPIGLRSIGLNNHAVRCAQVKSLVAAIDAVNAIPHVASSRYVLAARAGRFAADAVRSAMEAARSADVSADRCSDVTTAAFAATRYAAFNCADKRQIFTVCVSILDEGIRLGNEGGAIETALVVERMEKIKQRSLERV